MASGRLILPLAEPVLTATGLPNSGATLSVFISGGDTLASLFADAGLATPIANPQTSDSAGRFYDQSTLIFADATQAYDATLTETDGETFTYSDLYLLGAATNNVGFAPINSPAFTGTPTAPTPALNDNSQKLATTAFVQGQAYAPLASPNLTGLPTAPTAGDITNDTQIATTAFVFNAFNTQTPTSPTSGYLRINFLIIQWTPFSLGAAGGATQAVNWPIAFPNAVLGTPWAAVANSAINQIGVTAATTTGCTVNKGLPDTTARTGTVWAIGW